MNVAALWGKSVGVSDFGETIMIETVDGRVAHMKRTTFNYLYRMIDDYTAALKEDCIEYVIHLVNKPILAYPDWYIRAFKDGFIWKDEYGSYGMYANDSDICMSPTSIVLRNFKGELMYMEPEDFNKYYDTLEG